MTKEQLERANFLNRKIVNIDNFLCAHKKNVIMTINSAPSNNWDKDASVNIERKHQQELLGLLKKWRDEYQKELEEL